LWQNYDKFINVQIPWLWERLLKKNLDYVRILSRDFMTKIEHVTRTKIAIKTMLKY
jgi:hypothetical protein